MISNDLTWTQVKSHTSFTLSQKLEMVKLSEEGIMKVKIGTNAL